MHLLFDILIEFIKYLKKEIIDPVVDKVFQEVNLKSKFSVESFKFEILEKIYTEINDQLFNSTRNTEEEEVEGEDTDFECDSQKSHMTVGKFEILKEENLKTYKSMIIAKLIDYFNNVDFIKYAKGIEQDLKNLEMIKTSLNKSNILESEKFQEQNS